MTSQRDVIAGIEPFEMVMENAALEDLLNLEADLKALQDDYEDGWYEQTEYEWAKAMILKAMAKAKAKLNA